MNWIPKNRNVIIINKLNRFHKYSFVVLMTSNWASVVAKYKIPDTNFDLTTIENSVAETFIVCSGNSNTQVNAISGNIEKKVRNDLQDRPWHVEGNENALWVLLDYVSVVVHVFQTETRNFYEIEELWGDAKITKVENLN